jgi:alpha-1,4-galacturonosyltransferase
MYLDDAFHMTLTNVVALSRVAAFLLQNEDRTLWKLGTLPPGLITFYNLTYALPKRWHVLGLGYNAGVLQKEIEKAAVIHYNGNMKPWLEIGMSRYKPYWKKYVKYDHSFLQQCNINMW